MFLYGLVPTTAWRSPPHLTVMLIILTPLTLKGTRSMMMMQIVQPELKKLQAQYKDDRQKLNEEMMKFYKENNINPLSGCLPLLVQMPVFLVLYRVLSGLTHTGRSSAGRPRSRHRSPGKFRPWTTTRAASCSSRWSARRR